MHALGSEHPLREPCRRLVAAVRDEHVRATTTTDVIQQFVHAYARRRPRPTAAAHAHSYVTLLAPLISATDREVREGLRLFERHEELDAFDSVLAATAVAHDADAFVSADCAFAAVPALRHVVPGTAEFEGLLSR